jgi:hypothetical protein
LGGKSPGTLASLCRERTSEGRYVRGILMNGAAQGRHNVAGTGSPNEWGRIPCQQL